MSSPPKHMRLLLDVPKYMQSPPDKKTYPMFHKSCCCSPAVVAVALAFPSRQSDWEEAQYAGLRFVIVNACDSETGGIPGRIAFANWNFTERPPKSYPLGRLLKPGAPRPVPPYGGRVSSAHGVVQ